MNNMMDYLTGRCEGLRKEAFSIGDIKDLGVQGLNAARRAVSRTGFNTWAKGAERYVNSLDKPGMATKLNRALAKAQQGVGSFMMNHPDASLGIAGGLGAGATGLGAYGAYKALKRAPEASAPVEELPKQASAGYGVPVGIGLSKTAFNPIVAGLAASVGLGGLGGGYLAHREMNKLDEQRKQADPNYKGISTGQRILGTATGALTGAVGGPIFGSLAGGYLGGKVGGMGYQAPQQQPQQAPQQPVR